MNPWLWCCLLVLSGCGVGPEVTPSVSSKADVGTNRSAIGTHQESSTGKTVKDKGEDPKRADESPILDPFEDLNRVLFDLNGFFDQLLIIPLVEFYQAFIPPLVREGISNVLSNIEESLSLANTLLQFDAEESFVHLGRLIINSTLGVGGLIDVASRADIKAEKVTLGQTLKKMTGMPPGMFMVIPLLGPTTTRDSVGRVTEFLLHPLSFFASMIRWIHTSATYVHVRLAYKDAQQQLQENFDDPYLIMRNAYYESMGELSLESASDDIVDSMDEDDEGDIMDSLDEDDEGDIMDSLDEDDEGDIMDSLDEDDEGDIMDSLDEDDEGDIMDSLDEDDEGDIMDSMDEDDEGDIMDSLDEDDEGDIMDSLDEDDEGDIMDSLDEEIS